MEVAPCIELIPGANYYVVPKRIKPAPSEFVDQNTYYYRLVDGQMRLKGIALGPGWELRNFDAKKLSCYKQKGEGEMVKKLDWETLGPQIDELRAQGKTIKAIAEELGIGETTTQRYLANQKQTPTPEPVQAANQEPDEGEGEPATEIIPEKTLFCAKCDVSLGRALKIFWPRDSRKKGPLCERCYLEEPNEKQPTKAYYTEPVNIPLGCLLPPQGAELPRNKQEPANGCGDTTSDTKTNYGQGRGQSGEINWPPRDNVEKVLLENSINASFAVRRVLNDPVALALMKQVLESGVV